MTKLHCNWENCKTVVTLSEEQEDQKRITEESVGKMFGASYGVICDFHQKLMNAKNAIFRKKYGAAWPEKMNELYKKDKKAYNKIIALAEKNVREKKVKKNPVSYDAHSTKTALHPCDQCKRFVSMEHFKKWQETWIKNEDTECRDPLLCPKCGGAY